MDPITLALIAGAAALAKKGAEKLGESVVSDAYEALKAAIHRKLGGDSEVAKAVTAVEAKPDSDPRKGVLQEEIAASKADQDPELLQAAQALLAQLKAQPGGAQAIQQSAVGSGIAQAAGNSTATVNYPSKPDK